MQCALGIFGLGVMGRSLALNLADHGHAVAVYDRDPAVAAAFAVETCAYGRITVERTPMALVSALRSPAVVLLMVTAGPAVDEVIDGLTPFLKPGDVLMDGGNSHFEDTVRRIRALQPAGIAFLGVGISGGESGARSGPSIMAGGVPEAWPIAGPILTSIAARAGDGNRCCAFLGPDGAGHFIKMVHNGLEYAEMQLIAEAYDLLAQGLRMPVEKVQGVFAGWNRGSLTSYLIEITADILGKRDAATGRPMPEVISDRAGQKGTGDWFVRAALDLGVAAPTIAEAVFARHLSSESDERKKATARFAGPSIAPELSETFASELEKALFAATVAVYAQGFGVLDAASNRFGWSLDFARIAGVWRAGCIIRSAALDAFVKALEKLDSGAGLMRDPELAGVLSESQLAWRKTTSLALSLGVPVPALSSALAYYDARGRERLPSALIQAQRDYFGAHGYERVDRPGRFHADWHGGTEVPDEPIS